MAGLIILRDWQLSQIEFWLPVQDWPYDVSNLGRVRAHNVVVNRGGYKTVPAIVRPIIKPNTTNHRNSGGYARIALHRDGKTKTALLHRVVAQAFVSNPENLGTVNHLNGVKLDNRAANLQWSSQRDNIRHSIQYGLRKDYMWIRRSEIEYLRERVKTLEQQFELERHENRKSERHWANMLLRKANTFPLTPEEPLTHPVAPPRKLSAAQRLQMDEGEIEALKQEARRLGLPASEVYRRLFEERGLSYSESELEQ